MIDNAQYFSILPELVLTIFGIVIMMAEPLLAARNNRKVLGYIGFAGCLAALAATAVQIHHQGPSFFFDMIRVDAFSIFFHFVVIGISALAILSSVEYLDAQKIRSGEYYAL